MEYFIIGGVSFFVSFLTLFSGFGLGTILLPVFAIFFPIDLAIALTAIVHFLNNLFKLAFFGRYADKKVVLQFGMTAILAAFLGAKVLVWFRDVEPLVCYELATRIFCMTPVKLMVAVLMIIFVLFELMPAFQRLTFERRHLPWGGLLSGFFGGLSGHQGALRSAFLIKCGLSKESFIATGVVIACLIDGSRIVVYGTHFANLGIADHTSILMTAILCAFVGVWVANRLVKKITLPLIEVFVSSMIFIIAVLLGIGLI